MKNLAYTDIIGYMAAFGTTVSFLPQAIKTIQTKDTSGISLYMYMLFTAGTFLWLMYGLMSHSLPVAVANVITFVFASIILVYKLKYK
ncbi:SemiSWEET transporter [Mucilaginibacter sp. McL0603]|uniref:SemiSWEET transporter n=1 Tax=Mucilaginibacter sp. McL0603 TaxID=3415670 RepID=UPI003CE6E64C